MIWERLAGIRWLVIVQQIALAGSLFWGQELLFERLGFAVPPDGLRQYAIYFMCVVAGLILSGYMNSSWQHQLLDGDFVVANRQTMQQLSVVCGLLAVYLVATKDTVISRLFLGVFLFFFYQVLLFSNRFLPGITCRHLFRGARQESALLIGSIQGIEELAAWLHQKQNLGIRAVGVALREPTVEAIQDIPVLGALEQLETIVRRHGITQVIVVNLQEYADMVPRLMQLVETAGLRLLVQSNYERLFKHSLIYLQDNGLQFVSLRLEPLENPLNRVLKRLFDLAISGLVIALILPPVTVLVWLIQRFQSAGPVFFRQERSGIQNIAFRIFKFRSMRLHGAPESRQASSQDDRVYGFGRWMRRYSIDELPQFLNVWRGEMSVVGPRPHLTEHNDMFARVMKNYHIRTYVKPGITGLAQVRGFRGEITQPDDIEQRLSSDLYYIENWTLLLDVNIVIRTLWQVLFPPKQAY